MDEQTGEVIVLPEDDWVPLLTWMSQPNELHSYFTHSIRLFANLCLVSTPPPHKNTLPLY